MRMPDPDASTIARRAEIADELRRIVPGEGVIVAEAELRAYESDGLTAYHQPPMIVVLPETTEQVSRILRYCQDEGVKIVPRGAGTSLSGGALPLADGILLGLGKFNRVLDIDFAIAVPWSSRASPISASPMPSSMPDFITRPIRRARSPARS